MKILYVGKFREPAHIGDFRPVITAYGQLLNPHCEAGEELHLAFLPSEIDRPCANLITWQAATFIRKYDTLVPDVLLEDLAKLYDEGVVWMCVIPGSTANPNDFLLTVFSDGSIVCFRLADVSDTYNAHKMIVDDRTAMDIPFRQLLRPTELVEHGFWTLVPRLTVNRFIHRDNGSTAYPVISPNFAPYCGYEEVIDRGLQLLNAGEDATTCIPFQVFDMDPYEFLRGMNGE